MCGCVCVRACVRACARARVCVGVWGGGLWKGGGGGGSVCGVSVHLNLCCLNICKTVCKRLVPTTLGTPSHSVSNVRRA